ncbi:hypothetical protein M918_09495 [Clostridium sp. BL8]|nr:hypothetical protein M918_09495 [Clostridium sp. BL8]
MKLYINEKLVEVKVEETAFSLRDRRKKDADIVILNGFILKEDAVLKEGDKLSFIKRGETPSQEDMEGLLVSRHTPGVHEKLKKATVGIAGLGGLGSNIAVALARVGVGKLVLVDFDVVEPSNLNRQQYFIKHIGMKKTEAMKKLLEDINPFITVETVDTYLDKTNIEEVFKEAEVIVEAFDNPVCKAELTTTVLTRMKDRYIVGSLRYGRLLFKQYNYN